jgi:hypothetical protein
VIEDLYAGKENRSKLPPLVFKTSRIWANYYFNSEALPSYMKE